MTAHDRRHTDCITAEALLNRITSGTAPVILDVRSRAEYARGHVPGARHVPFWQVSRHLDEIAAFRDVEVVIYCGHGPRAHVAGRVLRRKGFTRIAYLAGHFSEWRSRGLREEL
jgi:rhodanese-related sulfurtransferase